MNTISNSQEEDRPARKMNASEEPANKRSNALTKTSHDDHVQQSYEPSSTTNSQASMVNDDNVNLPASNDNDNHTNSNTSENNNDNANDDSRTSGGDDANSNTNYQDSYPSLAMSPASESLHEIPHLGISGSPIASATTTRSRPTSSRSAAASSRSNRSDRCEQTPSSRSNQSPDQSQALASQPRSLHSTARSRHVTSRLELASERDDEPKSAAFKPWSESDQTPSPYTIGPFVLLLMDEFCRHYALDGTSASLQRELATLGVPLPGSQLWFEMHAQCQSVLRNTKHTSPLAQATTIERLVEFCASPQARKAVFSLEMATAHSPMHVCASPKRASRADRSAYSLMTAYRQMRSPIVRPSQRPSSVVKDEPAQPPPPPPPPSLPPPSIDAPASHQPTEDREKILNHSSPPKQPLVNVGKKKKKRKTRPHCSLSHSLASPLSHPSGHHGASSQPGTYGESVLVEAHKADVRRDLTATRLLEKELRHVRLEKLLAAEPAVTLQKKLGFHTLTTDEQQTREQLNDPYANELVLEKYGFSKRHECALCQLPFLPFNLPHKVSFRCIMDVHEHWSYRPPDHDTASKYKAPLCYDAVHVCRMCAQLVIQHAKTPETKKLLPEPTVGRPRSRKQNKRAKSLASLHNYDHDAASFCSDPYALPPLLGDDVYDHRDVVHPQANGGGRRGRLEHQDGDGRAVGATESPAKAIVYSQQSENAQFMSSKEWEIIHPDKSATRHRIQASLARA